MHKISAKPENPYGSRTLEKVFTLAHKVIHSFCAKAGSSRGWFGCQLFTHKEISQWNQGLWVVSPALRTILSTKDVQKRLAGEHCSAKEHDTIGKFAIFATIGALALFLRRGKISI